MSTYELAGSGNGEDDLSRVSLKDTSLEKIPRDYVRIGDFAYSAARAWEMFEAAAGQEELPLN